MDMEKTDPSLISIPSVHVSVTDSLGQKSRLVGNFAWISFEYCVGSTFEFSFRAKSAPGLLFTEPPQAASDEVSFSFDAGENLELN